MSIGLLDLIEDVCIHVVSELLGWFDTKSEPSYDIEPVFDIILDTETTGLPEMKGFNDYYSYTDVSKYNSSRITEICWSGLCGTKTMYVKNEVIKPFGLEEKEISGMLDRIPRHIMKQDIKQIMNGKDLKCIFDEFKNDLRKCRSIIAHNVNFDINVIKSEAYRIGDFQLIELINSKQKKCTMLFSCRFNSGRPMSLDNLYQKLTWKTRTNSHRADEDVRDLTQCVIDLRKNYEF